MNFLSKIQAVFGRSRAAFTNAKFYKKFIIGLYLLPAAVIFSIFLIWPILQDLYLSLFEWNMVSPNKKFVGLNNYAKIFTDPDFLAALKNSIAYVAVLLFFIFVVPYIVSFVLAQVVKKGSQIYRALMFFPSLLSLAVASIIFMWLYNPVVGPVPAAFKAVGMTVPNWLKDQNLVIFCISLITAWRCFGYNFIVFLAAIVEVPIELIEAAKLEKASNFVIFWRIVRPLTSSTALYVFIITFVFGMQYVFTPINMLTQGGPNQASTNIVYIIYQYGFNFLQTGKASAAAIISLILFMAIIVIQKRLEKRVHYEN